MIGQTSTLNSGVGSGAGVVGFGLPGGASISGSVSKSINPSDMVAGILMKKGFIVLDSVSDDGAKKAKTLLVRYEQGIVGVFLPQILCLM